MVTSKLNYALYFYIFLILSVIGVTLCFPDNKGSITALIPPILFAPVLCWILYLIQGLTIEPDQLRIFRKFTRRSLPRSHIRSIRLWDSKGRITDGISIETIDGESINLGGRKSFDQGGIWRNEFELKQALAKQYAELVDRPAREEYAPRPTHLPELMEPEIFRGNAFLSLNGLCLSGFAFVLIWGNITLAAPGNLSPWWGFPLASFAPVAMITLMTNRLFYFRIIGDSLEIRNHIIPWYKKEYPFTEINSAVIEKAVGRDSRKLYINTNDLKTHRYSAGSLRTKDWQALADALKRRHIAIKSQI